MLDEYIQNPKHSFSTPIERALTDMRARRMDALARRNQLAIVARPTAEEREQFHALHGVDSAPARDLLTRFRDRVLPIEGIGFSAPLTPMDNAPVEPLDSADFWWAATHFFGGGGIAPANETDGLHFFGRVSYNTAQLFPFNAGAWATFELQPERRPPSASGRYNSSPNVNLFGNLVGWTNLQNCPFACDDKWCKCWLFLRQTAIQFVDDIGTWRVCGENTSHQTLIDEEGNGRTVTVPLPGFLPMPFLQFGLLRPDRSVLVDLEVRFDVQLDGDSFIGFSPGDNPAGSVLLQYSQWPCFGA
jgi:hypothetical protein